jgi:hypothetical protein
VVLQPLPPLLRLLPLRGPFLGGVCCSGCGGLLLPVCCSDRSGDAAWAEIRAASTSAAAPLGPRDFRLLHRIGGGDIGTVYRGYIDQKDAPRVLAKILIFTNMNKYIS